MLKIQRLAFSVAFVLLATLALGAQPSATQTWPHRTVKFIVTLGPGSGTDIGTRLLADRLSKRWVQPVVVENRPGGDGIVAISTFVGANDDHVLLAAPSGSFTAHPFIYKTLPYRPADLVPIARVSNTIVVVAVPASLEVKSFADLVAMARAQPGKHPMTAHGVNDATTDRNRINTWWTESPNANIGIATGSEAGILVLDIDPRNKGKETLARLKKEVGPLPDTVTALTGGGGRHLVFQHPPFPVRKDTSGKLFGPGIDVLCDGCIMIAPPSRHVTGKRYRSVKGKAYRNREPAPFPQPWLDRLRGGAPAQAKTNSLPAAQVDGLITEGRRNNYLTSLAGTLQRSGVSPEALVAALAAENLAKCSPPLDPAEIETIVGSVTKYPALPGGDGDAAEQLMQLVLDRHFNGGNHLMLSTDCQFWHYDARLWRVVQDQWVSGKVLEIIQANPVKQQKTASLLSQVLTLLNAKLAVKDDALSFVANPPPVINCANGEVWIGPDGSVELRSHRPESHLRHCLDIIYDPDAVCPAYDKALLEIFGKADKPQAMVRHWNELVGYVIQPKRNIPIIVIMSGAGDNGKTVLAPRHQAVMVPGNVWVLVGGWSCSRDITRFTSALPVRCRSGRVPRPASGKGHNPRIVA
jgi:hypothetical protein